MSNSSLEYITKNDFLGLTQLTNIFLVNNKLKEIPCGVFHTNKRLQQLHFEDNSINKIGANIFEPLKTLRIVHFRKNICVGMDVDEMEDVPDLLQEVKNHCSTSCEHSEAYVVIASSKESELYKTIIIKLGDAVFNLKKTISSSKSENQILKNQTIELNRNLEEMTTKHNRIVENAKINEDNLNLQINNLQDTVTNFTTALNTSNTEILNLNGKKDELNIKLEDMTNKHNKTVEIANEKEKKLNLQVVEKDKYIIANKKKIKDLEKKIKIYFDERKKLIQTIESAKKNDKQYKDNITIMNVNINKITKEINNLEKTVTSLTTELNASNVEVLMINGEKDELNRKLEESTTEHNKTIENAKINENNFNINLNELGKNIVANMEQINSLENTVTNMNATNFKLQIELSSTIDVKYKLEKENDELKVNLIQTEIKHNQTLDSPKENQIEYRKSTINRNNNIAILITKLKSCETQKDWTILCSNDDQNDCYTKDNFVATEISDYTQKTE